MRRIRIQRIGLALLALTLGLSSVACLGNLLNQFAPTGTTKTSTTVTGIRVTAATAGVDLASYNGMCPKRLTFTGTITASEAGEVTYKWERNDGSASATQTLVFNAASSQTVTTYWDVSPSTTGSQRVHVLTPNDLSSNDARILVTCQ